MMGAEHAALVALIAEVVDRMPRSDPEAIALRIVGSLDQGGYEIRQKPGVIRTIGFDSVTTWGPTAS